MKRCRGLFVALLISTTCCSCTRRFISVEKMIPTGSRVFIADSKNGFGAYIPAALQYKKVPVLVVLNRERADFEITWTAESEQAGFGWLRSNSTEEVTIQVVNIRSGILAFAYAYNLSRTLHGKQSAAESCAKHLKWYIERKGWWHP